MCEFCSKGEDNTSIYDRQYDRIVVKVKGKSLCCYVESEPECSEGDFDEEMDIKYCPMCGGELNA